MFDRKRL